MPLAWPCPMLSMLSISQLHRHRHQQLRRRRQRRRWAGRLAARVGGLAAGFLVLLLELVVRQRQLVPTPLFPVLMVLVAAGGALLPWWLVAPRRWRWL